jgi:ubiquinone/menaquinone biosynthesis C-methylase UbiE
MNLVKNHEIVPPGTLLDVGCGTGENAIFFAQNKFTVSGRDLARTAIDQARSKAKERKVKVDFQEGNALALDFKTGSFDYVTDSGLFHTFDDAQRPLFRDEIARILKPKGVYFMMCFSDKEPTNWGGPRRVSKQEIIETFSPRFKINYIRDELFTTKIHDKGGQAYLTSATRL